MLKATNKMDDCLFVMQLDYNTIENNVEEGKERRFAFKIVSDKEYDMYKNMNLPVENEIDKESNGPRKVRE